MRRFPSSWDKTLSALGFRRKQTTKNGRFGRRSRLETLEVRQLLAADTLLGGEDHHWTFDASGQDSSGGANAVLSGAVIEQSAEYLGGGALRLQGNAYAALDHDSLEQQFERYSVSVWFKADDTNGAQVIYEEGGATNGIAIRLNGDQLEARVASGTVTTTATLSGVTPGEWRLAVATFDRGELKLYLDGAAQSDTEAAPYSVIPEHTDVASIGRQANGSVFGDGIGGYFEGLIDDVRVYQNTVLTADQVDDLSDRRISTIDIETDSFTYGGSPDATPGAAGAVNSGFLQIKDNNNLNYLREAYIEVDLSGVGSAIDSAALEVTLSSIWSTNPSADSIELQVHGLLGVGFDEESLSLNNTPQPLPGGSGWLPGSTFTVARSDEGKALSADVTGLVQLAHDQGHDRLTLRLSDKTPSNHSGLSLHSSESDPGKTPRLIISHSPPSQAGNAIVVTTLADEDDGNDSLDDLSLREALAIAEQLGGASTIRFDEGLYAGAGATILLGDANGDGAVVAADGESATQLEISGEVTIEGPGAELLIISGGGETRVLSVTSSALVTIAGLTITGGYAVGGDGGGVYSAGDLTLDGVTVTNNHVYRPSSSGGGGGGVYSNGPTLTLRNTTVSDNTAEYQGAGIRTNQTQVTIESSAVLRNAFNGSTSQGGRRRGAGVMLKGGHGTIVNSTIAQNSNAQYGGGVTSDGGADIDILNSTITENQVTGQAAGVYNIQHAGDITLHNTIAHGNIQGTSVGKHDVWGKVDLGSSNNLIGHQVSASGAWLAGTNNNLVGSQHDPMLAPLGDYGGPTETYALLPGSDAIDAGGDAAEQPATDQRGFARFDDPAAGVGGGSIIDIGAFEYLGAGPIVVNTTKDGGLAAGEMSLRQAIALAEAMPGPNEIAFDESVFGATQQTIFLSNQLAVTSELKIAGPGAYLLNLDGANAGSVFSVGTLMQQGRVEVELEGMTLANASSSGVHAWGDVDLSLQEVVIQGNADGVLVDQYAVVSLTNSTIHSNIAAGVTGTSSEITVVSSTISTNGGHGIAMEERGNLSVLNSTVVSNGLDGIYLSTPDNEGYALTINNSIVVGNAAGNIVGAEGASVSGESNLLGPHAAVAELQDTIFASDLSTAGVGALGDYGGSTPTHVLMPSSLAINPASNAQSAFQTDQRGFGVEGFADVGAFEYRETLEVGTNSLIISELGEQSIRQALAEAAAQPGHNTITFSPTLFDTPQVIDLSELDSSAYSPASLLIDSNVSIEGPGADKLTFRGVRGENVVGITGLLDTDHPFDFDPLNVSIAGVSITGGKSGVKAFLADLSLTDVAVYGNEQAGIDADGSGNATLTIASSSIYDNGTDGIFGDDTDLHVKNTTVSGNGSAGIAHNEGGSVRIESSTVVNNQQWGVIVSGIDEYLPPVGIYNSVILGNGVETLRLGGIPDVEPQTVLGRNNIFSEDESIGGITVVATYESLAEAGITSLGYNGGPTKTHALLPGSAAIDAGDSDLVTTTSDQRGLPRVFGEDVDIGAVESQQDFFVVDTVADEDDGDFSPGDRSLREVLSKAKETPGRQTITFSETLGEKVVIELMSELMVDSEVTIQGPGADRLVIDANADAENLRRVFRVDAPAAVEISGLSITGGYVTDDDGNGGGILSLSDLKLASVVVAGNTAVRSPSHPSRGLGGGVISLGGSNLSIEDSQVLNNTAFAGAGIHQFASVAEQVLEIVGSTVAFNQAVSGPSGGQATGGGVYVVSSSAVGSHLGSLVVDNSTVSNNTADNSGGVLSRDYRSVRVTNSTVAENRSELSNVGGVLAFYTLDPQPLTEAPNIAISNSLIVNNAGLTAGVKNYAVSTAGGGISPVESVSGNGNILTDVSWLGELSNYGGETLTHALSPEAVEAIDQGVGVPPNAADQRGLSRVVGDAVDIGAVEYSPAVALDGDFNGDGRVDSAVFDVLTSGVYVETGLGQERESGLWAPLNSSSPSTWRVGDFNGDGRDDLAFRESDPTGAWSFALSESNRFIVWATDITPDWRVDQVLVGDFDGDGRDELIGRKDSITNDGTLDDSRWRILEIADDGQATFFEAGLSHQDDLEEFDGNLFVGDVNRDGRDDLIGSKDPGLANTTVGNDATGPAWHVSLSFVDSSSGKTSLRGNGGVNTDWGDWFDGFYDPDAHSLDADGPLRFITKQFARVYNNTELELYYGIRKGPQATLDTGAASAMDQAALLTHLLTHDLDGDGEFSETENATNKRRFDPTLVTGDVTVSVEDAANWVGAKPVDDGAGNITYPALPALLQLLDPDFDIATQGANINPTDDVTFRHAWVRVQLPRFVAESVATNRPFGAANYIDLDPSWKLKDYQPGIELPDDLFPSDGFDEGLFDEIKFLDTTVLADSSNSDGFRVLPDTPLEFFEREVQRWLTENHPGKSLADVPYDGPLSSPVTDSLPLMSERVETQDLSTSNISQKDATYSEIVADTSLAEELTLRYRVSVFDGSTIANNQPSSSDLPYISQVFSTAETAHDALLIEISSSGFTTLTSNGTVIQQAQSPTGASELNDNPFIYVQPFRPGEEVSAQDLVTLQSFLGTDVELSYSVFGEKVSVAIDVGQYTSRHFDQYALQATTAINDDEPAESVLNILLAAANARYLSGSGATREFIAKHGQAISAEDIDISFVRSSLTTQPESALLELSPYRVVPDKLFIDSPTDHSVHRRPNKFVSIQDGIVQPELVQAFDWNAAHSRDLAAVDVFGVSGLSDVGALQRAYAGVDQYLNSSFPPGVPPNDRATAILVYDLVQDDSGRIQLIARGYLSSTKANSSFFLDAGRSESFRYDSELIQYLAFDEPLSSYAASDIEAARSALASDLSVAVNTSLRQPDQFGPGANLAPDALLGRRGALSLYLSEALQEGAGGGLLVDPMRVYVHYGQQFAGGAFLQGAFGHSQSGNTLLLTQPTSVFGPLPDTELLDLLRINRTSHSERFVGGEASVTQVDVTFPNSGLPLDYARRYSSFSTEDIGLGVGWAHSYSDRLLLAEDSLQTDANPSLIWLTSEGLEHRFEYDDVAAEYIVPSELLGAFTPTAGDNGYVFTARDGMEVHFEKASLGGSGDRDPHARLLKKVDLNNNGFEVAYALPTGDRIVSVTDVHTTARGLYFEYHASSHISQIELHIDDGIAEPVTEWDYAYDFADSEGGVYLTRVDAAKDDTLASDAVTHRYSYYGDTPGDASVYTGLLKSYTAPDTNTASAPGGSTTLYEYYPNGRVFRITDPDGGSTTHTYDPVQGRTTVRDPNGNEEVYIYNEEGLVTRQIHADRTFTETEWGVSVVSVDSNGDGFVDSTGQPVVDADQDGVIDGTEFLRTRMVDEVGAVENYEYYLSTTATNDTPGAYRRELRRATSKRFEDTQGQLVPGQVDGVVNEFEYINKNGVIQIAKSTLDPGGDPRVTTFDYEFFGRLIGTTDAIGGKTYLSYNSEAVAIANGGLHLEGLLGTTVDALGLDDGGSGVGTSADRLFLGRIGTFDVSSDSLSVTLDTADATIGQRIVADAVRLHRLGDIGTENGSTNLVVQVDDADAGFLTTGIVAEGSPQLTNAVGDTVTLLDPGATATWQFTDLLPGRYAVSVSLDGGNAIVNYTVVENGDVIFLSSYDQGSDASYWDRQVVYRYDTAGNVTKTRFERDFYDEATYDHNGLPTLTTDATKRQVAYDYDVLGRLQSTRHLGFGSDQSLTTSFVYEPSGLLHAATDAVGRATVYEYDRRGNLTKTIYADGTKVEFAYDDAGNRVSMTDELRRETSYRYDERNRLIETVLPDGAITRLRYDGVGRVAATVDAFGVETRFEYDAAGRLVKTTAAAGTGDAAVANDKYNVFGELIETIDAEGNVTQFVYDKLGRLVKTMVLGDADSPGDTLANNRTETVDAAARPVYVQTTQYDAVGNVVGVTVYDTQDSNNKIQGDALRSDDLASRISDDANPNYIPHGSLDSTAYLTSTFEYDLFNRRTSTVFADNTDTRLLYDNAGRTRFAFDENGSPTESVYDAYGRLERMVFADPDGDPTNGLASPIASYSYDAVGNVISSTDPNNNTTAYVYDDRNRLIVSTDAIRANNSVVFDTAGQAVALIDAAGVAVASRYDSRGRLTRRSWVDPDGQGPLSAPAETYEYYLVGNVSKTSDARGFATEYFYDKRYRLEREQKERQEIDSSGATYNPGPATTLYTYDGNSNVTETTDARGFTTTYSYDEINRLNLETLPDPDGEGPIAFLESLVFGYSYDGYSNIVEESEKSPGGTVYRYDTFKYDQRNRLVEEVFNASGTDDAADQLRNTYDYDDAGNLIEMKQAVRAGGAQNVPDGSADDTESVTTRYGYDSLNRVVAEHFAAPFNGHNPVSPGRHSILYRYDDAGNLTADEYVVRDGAGASSSTVTDYVYDGVNRIVSVVADSGRIAATSRTSYDAVGNPLFDIDPTGLITRYEYDELYRQTRALKPDPSLFDSVESPLQEHFTYDESGNLATYVNGEGDTTSYEYNTFGQVTAERVLMPSEDIVTNYAYDATGNRTQITDPSGNLTTYEYDGWGRVEKEIQGAVSVPGNTREYRYDNEGNFELAIDRNGRVVEYSYDGLDRVISERWFDDVNAYGADTSTAPTNTDRLEWGYDKFGRVIDSSYWNRRVVTNNAATPFSSTTGYNDSYAYDRLSRVVKHQTDTPISFGPDFDQSYRYDIVTGIGTDDWVAFEYSQDFLLPGVPGGTDPTVAVTTTTLDGLGRVSRIADGGPVTGQSIGIAEKTVDFRYDDADRMLGVSRWSSLHSEALDTSYAYDQAGRIDTITHGGGGVFAPATHSYKYDNASRLLSAASRTSVPGGGVGVNLSRAESYQYDAAGRLEGWSQTLIDNSFGAGAFSDRDQQFTIDASGNRTATTSDSDGDSGKTIDPVGYNRIASDGEFTYSYDEEGNLTERLSADNKTVYTWDHRNRLVGVGEYAISGGMETHVKQVQYVYNNDDLRVRRIIFDPTVDAQDTHNNDFGFRPVEAETFVYDGGQLVATLRHNIGADDRIYSGAKLTSRYVNGPGVDAPLIDEAFTEGTNNFERLLWLTTDHAGSVRDVFDEGATLQQHVEYDQFGEVSHVFDGAGTELTPAAGGQPADLLLTDLAFTGREWDDEADLYYNRARWYDSGQGRFISEDPIGFAGGDANLYRYTGGDPVNYRDPSGLFEQPSSGDFYEPYFDYPRQPPDEGGFGYGGGDPWRTVEVTKTSTGVDRRQRSTRGGRGNAFIQRLDDLIDLNESGIDADVLAGVTGSALTRVDEALAVFENQTDSTRRGRARDNLRNVVLEAVGMKSLGQVELTPRDDSSNVFLAGLRGIDLSRSRTIGFGYYQGVNDVAHEAIDGAFTAVLNPVETVVGMVELLNQMGAAGRELVANLYYDYDATAARVQQRVGAAVDLAQSELVATLDADDATAGQRAGYFVGKVGELLAPTPKFLPKGLSGTAKGSKFAPRSATPPSTPRIHGNSLNSPNPNHAYVIVDTANGSLVKPGVSGSTIRLNGNSPRATSQVNQLNQGQPGRYKAVIVERDVSRPRALEIEQLITDKHAARNAGASPSPIHQRPRPQVQSRDEFFELYGFPDNRPQGGRY